MRASTLKAPVPDSNHGFEFKHAQLLDILDKCKGNLTAASKEIGCTQATATNRFDRSIAKYGVDRVCKAFPRLTRRVTERANVTAIRDKPSLQPDDLIQAARELHSMPTRMLDRLQHRVDMRIPDPDTVIESEADLLTTIQSKMALALGYMDRVNLASATLNELTSAVKNLFDMQQILQGKPTQINASQNMRAIKDLLPAILKEATRRGITIEGQIDPPPKAHPPAGVIVGSHPPHSTSDFLEIPPNNPTNTKPTPNPKVPDPTTMSSTEQGYVLKKD